MLPILIGGITMAASGALLTPSVFAAESTTVLESTIPPISVLNGGEEGMSYDLLRSLADNKHEQNTTTIDVQDITATSAILSMGLPDSTVPEKCTVYYTTDAELLANVISGEDELDVNSTSLTVTGTSTYGCQLDTLTPDTEYYITVIAWDNNVPTVLGVGEFTTLTSTPNKIKLKSSDVTYDSLTISWTKQDCDAFKIYRAVGNGKFKLYKTVSSKVTSLTETNLKEDTDYQYKIRAIKTGKIKTIYGKYSDILTVHTELEDPNTDQFIWPTPTLTTVTSEVGQRWGAYHAGVDISGSSALGSDIVASEGGTVVFANQKIDSSGYGLYVIIDHGNGYMSLYGHCSKVLVKVGDTVKQGDVIAKVGSTGDSTGPHLHWEIRSVDGAKTYDNYFATGKKLNPLKLLVDSTDKEN
jgi:murein DD-endopeptidase MepM/ murein hydrolase activator NlpD